MPDEIALKKPSCDFYLHLWQLQTAHKPLLLLKFVGILVGVRLCGVTVLTQGLFISESKTQGIDACASSLPCILMLLNVLVRGGYETSKCIDNNKHCTCYNDATT